MCGLGGPGHSRDCLGQLVTKKNDESSRSPIRHAACSPRGMASPPSHARLSTMSRPTRPATYADIAALPPNVVGEILGGILHVHPRPALPHAHVTSVLGGELGPPFHRGKGGPGGWVILYEPELHLVEDVVVPDLAGRRSRTNDRPHEGVHHGGAGLGLRGPVRFDGGGRSGE